MVSNLIINFVTQVKIIIEWAPDCSNDASHNAHVKTEQDEPWKTYKLKQTLNQIDPTPTCLIAQFLTLNLFYL